MNRINPYFPFTTVAIGEEGGGNNIGKPNPPVLPPFFDTPKPKNGKGNSDMMTSMAMGEEGGGEPTFTTMAMGEEGGGENTTMAMGEEGGGGPTFTTKAIGEEGGGKRSIFL